MATRQKTDSTFEGMRVTLTDGTKDRIAKVGRVSYKTQGGVVIQAGDIKKRGRGLIVIGDSPAKNAPKATASTEKSEIETMTRTEIITKLVDAGKLSTRREAKGVSIADLREMVSKIRKKKNTTKPSASDKKPAPSDSELLGRRDCVQALLDAGVFEKRVDAKGIAVSELREMVANLDKKKPKQPKQPKQPAPTEKKMTRKELVTALVESGKFEKRTEARGVSVEDLRELLEAKPKRKPKTSSGRGKKDTTEPSESSGIKRRNRGRSSNKAKTVHSMTDKLSKEVEEAVREHIGEFLSEKTGHKFTVACTGGMYNEERMTLQIGLLPTDASEEDIASYAADMTEAEDASQGEDQRLSLIEKFADGALTSEKIARAIDGWDANFDDVIEPKLGDEVQIGTKLDYNGSEAMVIGFSDAKKKVILLVLDSSKVKVVDLSKVVRMEILDEEPAETEEEQDDEEFEDLDDEEEDDLDEEEDDLDEEDDEEEDDFEEEDEDDLEEDLDEEDEDDLDDEEEDDFEEDEDDLDEEDEDEDEDDEEDFDDFDDEL